MRKVSTIEKNLNSSEKSQLLWKISTLDKDLKSLLRKVSTLEKILNCWKNSHLLKKFPTLEKSLNSWKKFQISNGKCSKQISYTFLKNVLSSDSLYFLHSKKILCLSSRRFLYRSQLYWRFFSFSSSERFPYHWWANWHFLCFSSLERFWYLSCASFWSFS